jgi:hypothetical protein
MSTRKHWTTAIVLTTAFAVCFILAGCEKTETDLAISILLSSDTVAGKASITCTATPVDTAGETSENPLLLPLEWWVSNPELGTVVADAGYTAVYVSKGTAGGNIIGVRDQRDAEGVVGITHISEEE